MTYYHAEPMKDHWALHAQRWHLHAPPLRPSEPDVAIVRDIATIWRKEHDREPHVVVLGVTPEYVGAFQHVTAVDVEPAMIKALFKEKPGHRAVLASWLSMPLEDASVDLIVGDGSTNVIDYPDDYKALVSELHRVLRPGGSLALRLFAAPEVQETMDQVRAALDAGTISNFNVLKWRIAMAVPTVDFKIRSQAIMETFNSWVPDREAFAAKTGWPRDVIENIDIYKNSEATRAYPPVSVVRSIFSPPFHEQTLHVKSYEMGDRCPTIVFRR